MFNPSTKHFGLTISMLVTLIFTGSACSVRQEQDGKQLASGLFVNRPIKRDRIVAIIKLKNLSLYESVELDQNGKPIVDQERAKQIDLEQLSMQSTLQKLAQDHAGQVEIIFRYRYVLNALAIVASSHLLPELQAMGGISYVERESAIARPNATQKLLTMEELEKALDSSITSVSHIGASLVREQLKIDGKGIKVGIVDTGIDYTHLMLGGSGKVADYEQIDPDKASSMFPNQRVVGGRDFCGSKYNSASPIEDLLIPKPDENPLDEDGHGTHVAGSVAGHKNGSDGYDGVAPGADLYALKVFGKDGSTGDAVILASLEWASDPNNDGNAEDRLDVINMSLGSNFGKPHILYSEAVENMSKAGIIVVASAGNSGDVPYITGAPATSASALSVAASIDGMEHNWKFNAVKFLSTSGKNWISEAVEASFTLPISEAGDVKGELVFAGFADEDFSDELAQKIKGRVAFISRGKVAFSEKVKRAAMSGAVGVVVFNNQEGAPFVMGGDQKYMLPAIMISKTLGDELLESLKSSPASIHFQTPDKIEKPELIDTLTSFSSRGPRAQDSLIKPEISAPGSDIISAKSGGGAEVVSMSGTSMAAPHMSGVMALVKAKYPALSIESLKALVMGTSLTINDAKGVVYPVALQGAGRVDVYKALTSEIYATPNALSLGLVSVSKKKTLVRRLEIKNMSEQEVTYTIKSESDEGLLVTAPKEIRLAPKSTRKLTVYFTVSTGRDDTQELDGRLLFIDQSDKVRLLVPFLAVRRSTSHITAGNAQIFASGPYDDVGARVLVELENKGAEAGPVYAFNLIGKDERQLLGDEVTNRTRSRVCDLQSAGQRLVERESDEGKVTYLQIAVKLYRPVTRWQACDVSVLIDADNDGQPEQELVGLMHDSLPGLSGDKYGSFLLDYKKARELRREYELLTMQGHKPEQDYTSAIIDDSNMLAFEHSSLAIVEARVDKLAKTKNGFVSFKVVLSNEDRGSIEPDDYLDQHLNAWQTVDVRAHAIGLIDEVSVVPAGGKLELELVKGEGRGDLVLYAPKNRTVSVDSMLDDVELILDWEYLP